jgi:hypothetical protein
MSNSNVLTPNNPANKAAQAKGERKRVPMSVPMRKLETPDLPGYHLHWMKESNIPRALGAYYEFVTFDEVPINQRSIGTSTELSGNASLGSHVEIAAGTNEQGKPENLVLMKLKEEYWLEDRASIDERNANVMGGIFRGETILGTEKDAPDDRGSRYVDKERTKAVFNRPVRKAKP